MKNMLKLFFPFIVRTRDDEGKELPEDIFEFEAEISNGNLDGHYSRMGDCTLSNYAEDASNGVPMTLDHEDGVRNQIGMFIAGTYDEAEKRVRAIARMLRDNDQTPDNLKVNEYIRRIDAGLYRGVSVEFRDGQEICDMCSKDVWDLSANDRCKHIPGRIYAGEKATYEIKGARLRGVSLVSHPSNKEAGVIDVRSDDWTAKEFDKFKLLGDGADGDSKSQLELEGEKYRDTLIVEALKQGVRAEDDFDETAWKTRLEDWNSELIIAQTKTWTNAGDAKWGKGGRKTTDNPAESATDNPIILPDYLFQ